MSNSKLFLLVFSLVLLIAQPTWAVPPVAGYTLLLDATDVNADGIPDVIADGDDITVWNDLSVNTNDVTQLTGTTAPKYQTVGQNSLPVIDFASATLESAPVNNAVITGGSSYTKFVVYKLDDSTSTATQALVASGTFAHSLYSENSRLVSAHGTSNYLYANASSSTGFQVATTRYGNPGLPNVLRYGKTEVAQNTVAASHNPSNISIGGWGGFPGNLLDGKIAEVIVYDSALSDADILLVEDYLTLKWGLPVFTPSIANVSNSSIALTIDGAVADTVESNQLTASILDNSLIPAPVQGEIVSFSLPTDVLSASTDPFCITGTDGTCVLNMTSSVAGDYTFNTPDITIDIGAGAESILTSAIDFTFIAGPADATNSTVSVNDDVDPAKANGSDTFTLEVTILDANDNPVENELVTFTQPTGTTLSSTTCTTDADGLCSVTVTSTTAGDYASTVSITDGNLSNSPANFTFIAGTADATTSTVTAAPASVVADGTTTSTVTVTVLDANDNPVIGSTVSLAQGAGSSNIGAVSPIGDGTYTFTVTSTTAEAVTYTATADGVTITDTADVTFTAGAANATQSSVAATPLSVLADGTATSTVTVTVLDANDNPVIGSTVSLAQGAGSSSIGAVSPIGDGTYTFTVTSTTAEAVTYTATADGVTITDTADVTFTAGAANATQSSVAATPLSVLADGTATSTVTVTVLDANDNPVIGSTVSLAQGTGSSSIGAVSPIGDGTYTFTVTSTTAEAVTYTATADGVTITDTADVTFTAGAANATQSSVAATPLSVLADGTATSTVTVTVLDANDNPVIGTTVSLAQGTGSSSIGAVSPIGDGTYTFTVTSTTAETVTYTATADTVTITDTAEVTFDALDQTIAFTPPATKTFGDAPFTVSATSTSGLTVSIVSDTLAVCNIDAANEVTIVTAGTCTLTATQAGDATYSAATPVSANISVDKADQAITFIPPTSKTFGDPPFSVSATATSGLPVSITSTTLGVCTVAADTVTIISEGTCILAANQAGNANYNAATEVTANITASAANQVITFTPPATITFGDAPFTISATASSGLAVTDFGSTTIAVCTVNGSTVTIIAGGTCTLTADQAGDSNYNPAPQVSADVTVAAADQTISFTPPATKTFGDAPFTISATSTSGLVVSFASTTASVCTVSGDTVTLVSDGTCTITADQAGDSNYNAAPQVSGNIVIDSDPVGDALAAIIEDIAGNTDGTPATAEQLNLIAGVSGAVIGTDYSDAFAAGTFVQPASPTAPEIQTVVDALNAAIAAVLEDIAGNADGVATTAEQINLIASVIGALSGADYADALAAGTYADPANPTAAEIQAVIDAENANIADALAAVIEDITGNADGIPVTAEQINLIAGVADAVSGKDYTAALVAGIYVDPDNPTAAEIQAVIDAENAKFVGGGGGGGATSLSWLALLGLIALLRRRRISI